MRTRKVFPLLAVALAAATQLYAQKVTLSSVPPAVQQAIRSKAGPQAVDIDREIRANGQITYEASWKENGVQQELLVSETGTVLRDVVGPSRGLSNSNLTLANRTGVGLP